MSGSQNLGDDISAQAARLPAPAASLSSENSVEASKPVEAIESPAPNRQSLAQSLAWRSEVLADELGLRRSQVEKTLALLDEGATLPFIARYRKEVTGGLDEVQIGTIQERGTYLSELLARKTVILAEVQKQGKLTPELQAKIVATLSKTELEDLYLPYKPKRRTRATIAREKGLEPLALKILAQDKDDKSRDALAAPYFSAEHGLSDSESVFAGARDIVAELISDDAAVRAALRAMAMETGLMRSRLIPRREEEEDGPPEPGNEKEPGPRDRKDKDPKAAKKEDPTAKFSDYFDYQEAVKTIPSHRVLALRRGEKEGALRVTLEMDRDAAVEIVKKQIVNPGSQENPLRGDLDKAIVDAWERLLKPAIEVDVRLALRERADAEAIRVFAQNLRHLLLAPPLGGKRVLALDPGYRTGCKLAIVDEKGDLGVHDVLFPTQSDARRNEAAARAEQLVAEHKIQAIAIGNGTAGRETEAFVRRLAAAGKLPGVKIVVVNEAGASVYSTSEIGRQEMPTHDPTVRGAVSIGRRLQDPLAELVKIEPKSIGVGQYQHDVHQPTLKRQLDQVVESCVNSVGVDINTASPRLLQYVAGIGESLANSIVSYRSEHGPFTRRQQILDVPRMGPKSFEQAAGFLRIREGAENPLDNSAVHPESYDVVERMATDLGPGVTITSLINNRELLQRIEIGRYIDERRGEPTLRDILAELEKPGRDPRREFEEVGFNPDVTEVSHLKEGMVLNGVVTNVTNFGAFVDVGVHQDGLVHVSELAHRFIKDPAEAVKVGEKVKVKVIKVELDRMRIGLSMKAAAEPPSKAEAPAARTDTPRRSEAPPRRDKPAPQKEQRSRPQRPEGRDFGERKSDRPERGPRDDRPVRDHSDRPPRSDRPDRGERSDREARPAGGGKGGSPFNMIRGLNVLLKK